MKRRVNLLPPIFFTSTLFILVSCSSKNEEGSLSSAKEETLEITTADSVSDAFSSYEPPSTNTIKRQFARTANLNFRVKDVKAATQSIEHFTLRNKGFITSSNMTSSTHYVNQVEATADSILETHSFTLKTDLKVRIPDDFLDSALAVIGKHASFWDSRNIESEDVSFVLLENHLKKKRLTKNEGRVKRQVDTRLGKIEEAVAAEQLIYQSQEDYDRTRIREMELADRVKFSTINIILYQRPQIMSSYLPKDKEVLPYQHPYGRRVLNSFTKGWMVLQEAALVLILIWPILLIGAFGFWIYRKKAPRKVGV